MRTAIMLVVSNCFMTFAWYGHLRNLNHKAWYIAALVSWGIALFEYLVQVPANRLGFTQMSLAQLKILQEAVTLSVLSHLPFLYEATPEDRLFLCPALYHRSRLFYLSFLISVGRWKSDLGIDAKL
jgi:uncharacterized protein (DUF486 family)